jgi:hypothetical protein
MAFIKHVGRTGDRKVLVLYRQVPGEDHMCLVIYPETIAAHWQDAIQRVVESDIGQQAEELADALHRSFLPDGRAILQTLHQERMIKKVRAGDVIMTPNTNSNIRLDELNKMLNEMKLGSDAIKKMAENDASRGMVDPSVKRAAEAEYKAGREAAQVAAANPGMNFQAPQDGALSDRDIAANMVFQAKKMELEAKNMIAEAARMKKDAQRMDPNVVAKEAPQVAVTAPEPAAPRRGRPPKSEAQVTDAAES